MVNLKTYVVSKITAFVCPSLNVKFF